MTLLHAEYSPFVTAQLALMHQINDKDVTTAEVKVLVQKQREHYIATLEKVLLQKKAFLRAPKPYTDELFLLKKLTKWHRAHKEKYMVIRDEVKMKSYQIMQLQEKTLRALLHALDDYSFKEYEVRINDEFILNQDRVAKINTVDYKPYLELRQKSKTLQEAQQSIKDYYALIEINNDLLGFYALYTKRMYRLNKYTQYKILPVALYLDHSKYGKQINTMLYPYGLSIVKLPLILLLSFFIYMIRRPLYKGLEVLLQKTDFMAVYTKEVLARTHSAINLVFIVVNLNLVVYVYDNFYTQEGMVRVFNIAYTLLFTYILYRVLNIIAGIRIEELNRTSNSVKGEIVNVTIKIVNFLILIMGVLLVLYFAGANLATVLSGLGIGGFAIAIAARESLSNFLGTIAILMSDTFSQGDWIEIDDKEGTVVEIGLRVTTLRTFDNSLVSIPNGTLANHDVQNWDKRIVGRRIKMSLGVKYGSKPEDIRQAISEIREMLQQHPNIATNNTDYRQKKAKNIKVVSEEDALGVKRTLLVYLDELSDSSINILVYCFAKQTDWNLWLETKEDVIFKIMDILEKNSLEFAYPSLSLYHEKEPTSVKGAVS